MSASSLVVTVDGQERVIAASEIGWVERRGDPLWNGALLGLGLALPAAGSAGASCSPNCDREVPQAALVGAALGVGIGTLIDYAWRGRTLVFGMPPTGRTEPPVDSLGELWSRVRPRDLVSVRLTNGADVAGKFARASESSLTVAVDGQPRDLSVIIVQQVERRRGGNHVKRNMLIGAPLGALLGSGRCYRVDTYSRPTSGPSCGASVGIGAAAGAGIGAVLGSMTWSRTRVYRARSE